MNGIIHVVYVIGDNYHYEHEYVGDDENTAKESLQVALRKWGGQCEVVYDKWKSGKKVSSEIF
ncbi:hypothetical protein JCM10914A_55890 [Paenibacillus sp. JCM 10914]|uniref:hypothetical protein n=1 Tax=Paenibacillus sp. JCM 10914 TaxID=1236974 RepID=UPI0003CC6EA1|nr:hypothetical protein [Paenibacillus sp. JCM 10914]GAE09609.1 hypothetical protein JCM10914_5978 [Paenibacillus sp. JCM 10914]